jgi:hypothetical protein
VADGGEQKGSFWTSLPGMLTALATLVTACTGLYLAVHKSTAAQNNSPVTPSSQTKPVNHPGPGPTEAFQIREAKADARNYQLHCPSMVAMKGTIEGDGRGVVAFRFVLSDGTATPVQRLEFEPPSMDVTSQFEMNRNFRGASQLEIQQPVQMLSHPSNFAMECR